MKKSLLIIIIMICTSTFAQSPTDSLDIKVALKDEYVIGDIINFEYFNKSHKYLRVHISLERADDEGKWIPFFHEIFCEHKFQDYDNKIFIILNSHFSLSKYSNGRIENYRKDKWTVKNLAYMDKKLLHCSVSNIPLDRFHMVWFLKKPERIQKKPFTIQNPFISKKTNL